MVEVVATDVDMAEGVAAEEVATPAMAMAEEVGKDGAEEVALEVVVVPTVRVVERWGEVVVVLLRRVCLI